MISLAIYAVIFLVGNIISGLDGPAIIFILGSLEELVLLILGIINVAIGKHRLFRGIGFLISTIPIFILGWAGCVFLYEWRH